VGSGSLRRFLSALLAIALGLGAAELGLRGAFAFFPELRARATGQEAIPSWLPDEQLLYRPNPAHPGHDARGFRNPEALARADLVALGDSQTYGSGVSTEEAWPQLLARQTGRSVYNMAFPGWCPVQSLLLADEALALRPRVVIEAFYAGNDLYDAFAITYGRDSLRDLRSADPGVLAAVKRLERQSSLEAQASVLFDSSTGTLRGWLERQSALFAVTRTVAIRTLEVVGLRATGWPRARAACERDGSNCEVSEAGDARTLFTPAYRWIGLDPGDVRIAEGERIATEALLRLDARLREGGARLVVLAIPTKERAYAESGLLRGGPSAAVGRLAAADAALATRLGRALEAQNIPFLDATPALGAALRAGVPCYRESTDGHPSPEGQRVLAEALAAFLARRAPDVDSSRAGG
jgi:lysophospholipase L1-like esterase